MLKRVVIEKEKEILGLFSLRLKTFSKDAKLSPVEENSFSKIVSLELETGGEDHPVFAQYHFVAPEEEDVDTMFFHQNICLRDSLDDALIKLKVMQASNVINSMLPFGYFGLDENLEFLCCRSTLAIPAELDPEIAEEYISKNSLKALKLVMRFASPLKAFANGDAKEDKFLSTVMAMVDHFNDPTQKIEE